MVYAIGSHPWSRCPTVPSSGLGPRPSRSSVPPVGVEPTLGTLLGGRPLPLGYGGGFIIPPVQLPNRGAARPLAFFCSPGRRFLHTMQSVIITRSTLALSNRAIGFRIGVAAGEGENGIQHCRGDAAGERVLLTWMVTADEHHFVRCLRVLQPHLRAVTERRARPREGESALAEHRPYRLPGKSTQANDNPQFGGDQTEFGGEPWRARVPFCGFRLIVWRGASDRRHHPGVD